jgi:PAS domain S-box-containing protein
MPGATQNIHVLHVDDDPAFVEVAADLLEQEGDGLTVQTANSASEGLDLLEDEQFDCVVSDYDMPGTDGLDLLESVREGYPDLPFILCTGKGSEEIASQAISAGVTDYLQKDSATEQYEVLANRIHNFVAQTRAERRATETEQYLEELATVSNDTLWMFSADWEECLYMNEAYSELYGQSLDTVRESVWNALEAVHPDDREDVEEVLNRLSNGEEMDYEHRVNAAEDYQRWVWVQAIPIRDDQGEVVRIAGFSRDITERKQREQQLQANYAFNEVALESVLDFYWVLDTDGYVTDWSDEDGTVTGYPSEEAVGMHSTEMFPVREREYIREKIAELRETGSVTAEADFRRKDGELVPYRFDGTVMTDDGQVERLCGFGQDISEQREREQQLREERDLNEQIINTIPDIFSVADVDGELQRWNTRVPDVTGYTEAELAGKNAVEFFAEEDREQVSEAIEQTLATGQATVDARVRTADAELIPYEFTGARLTDSDGDMSGLVGIGRNITEQQQREHALEELHEATRDLMRATTSEEVATIGSETATEVLELSMNGIHLFDAETDTLVPVAWTEQSDELLGGSPPPLPLEDSIAGQAYRAREAERYGNVQEADRPFNADTPFRSELYLPLGDHGVFILSSTEPDAFDATDEALAHVLASNVETALDRVEQRQQLRRERDKLDEFASVVSHDLRNPLNLAQVRLELARDECASEHLENVEYGITRSLSLIDDLLVLAKQGASVGEKEDVDLAAVVEHSWQTIDPTDVTLAVDIEKTIRADESRLKQLVENLLRNAVKHTEGEVTVEVGGLPGGFYVADDGAGIPADEPEQVFDPGFSTSESGTGFGLKIVREIADAHGWDARVTASESGGARFEFTGVESE